MEALNKFENEQAKGRFTTMKTDKRSARTQREETDEFDFDTETVGGAGGGD